MVFEVYPNHIIIECNEDGFTEKNLSAICNIGKSSKSGTQAYIGEKGIGFKSVFKVAYKAVVQSGYFCFSFTHRRGDSGMGMISPQWEENQPPVEPGRTRITLWLHQDQASEDLSSNIAEQFEAIHEEMLLFMRKIQRIEVKTYDDQRQLQHSSMYSRHNDVGQLVSTERLRREGGDESRTIKHFHLTNYIATDLPKSETREYNDDALATESYARSEIVLAFPLTEDSVPFLDNQWLFSFLPVSQTGFKVRPTWTPIDPCTNVHGPANRNTLPSSSFKPTLLPRPVGRASKRHPLETVLSAEESRTPSPRPYCRCANMRLSSTNG